MSLLIIAVVSVLVIAILAIAVVLAKSNKASKEALYDSSRNLSNAKRSLQVFNAFLNTKASFIYKDAVKPFSEFDSRIHSMKSAIETLDYDFIKETAQSILRKHDMIIKDSMSQRLYNEFLNALDEIANL